MVQLKVWQYILCAYYTVGHTRLKLQQFPVYFCLLLTQMCVFLCVCVIYNRKLKIHAALCAAYF